MKVFRLIACLLMFLPNTTSNLDAKEPAVTKSDAKTGEKSAKNEKTAKNKRPQVDIAILLDTSNSMDGLISQARTQLWNIVQQVAKAEKKNQKPLLRVAVFEYGNSNLPATENYLRQVVPLTDDLDKVSEGLFGLETEGGDEYCGAVIKEAVKRLDWSNNRNSYKAIYIAGNEPFSQGEVDYEESCRAAIESGIVVNTIHCGAYERGVSGQWKSGADLAEGKFMNINQDRKIVQIKTPHDAILITLNNELNQTYLWYGARVEREAYANNQILQDKNSINAGASLSRIATKAGAAYSNRGRDLVDSWKDNPKFLEKIDEKMLPEIMQKMSASERKKHISKMATKRQEIQIKINAATQQRDAFIAAQKSNQIDNESDTLGEAIGIAVQSQLQDFGFQVE